MNKKAYIIPETTVITVELQQLIAMSGGGEGLTVSPDPDESDEDNRTRRSYNCWDDEE